VLRLTAEVDLTRFHATAQRALAAGRSQRGTLTAVALAAYTGDVLPADRYSNASGEGAGNFYYPNCNRGEASYQYQAALALEHKLKGHAGITFVSPACSGARSQHLVHSTYDGIDGDTLLAPQITSLRALLSQHKGSPARTVSTAMLSIGINNIGFGPLLAYCLMNPPGLRGTSCDQQEVVRHDDGAGGVSNWSLAPPGGETLDRQVLRLVRQLRDRYSEVAASLHGLVSPRDMYLSQYPTEVYGDHSNTPQVVCLHKTALAAALQPADLHVLPRSRPRVLMIFGTPAWLGLSSGKARARDPSMEAWWAPKAPTGTAPPHALMPTPCLGAKPALQALLGLMGSSGQHGSLTAED